MASFSAGDRIYCRIKNNTIVNTYSDWDIEHIFEIISSYEEGYMIYIPVDLCINNTILISQCNIKKFNIDKRFIGSYTCYITDYKVSRIHSKLDGIRCSECECFCEMAIPDKDTNIFICWNCRTYPFYK